MTRFVFAGWRDGVYTCVWMGAGWAEQAGKGTKKNKYVWNQAVIARTLAAYPAATLAQGVDRGTAPTAASAASLMPVATAAAVVRLAYIDTLDTLEVAAEALQSIVHAASVVGTGADTEAPAVDQDLRPPQCVVAIGTKFGAEGLCQVVQLATASSVYLFDCASLAAEAVAAALGPLCACKAVVKVAHDIHQTAHVLHRLGVSFAGVADVQLAVELLTGHPSRSFSECLMQLHAEGTVDHKLGPKRTGATDASFNARPLPDAAKQRAAKEVEDLLGVWPLLLDAVGPEAAALQDASDLRAAAGAASVTGSRQIVFDAANSYAIASPELLQSMRPGDMKVPDPLVVSNDTGVLLDLLPADIAGELRHTDGDEGPDLTLLLSDIVLDKGRRACAWVDGKRMPLGSAGQVVEMGDIESVLDRLGGFGSDNRAGLEQQLHRISGMRNRYGDVIGLTMRVGRHVSGNADMISDLLLGDERSILFLGEPGSGKTTVVREATRLLAMESNVCIVDTSNEIAGDGDVPHPCIGLARRMMVPSLDDQAAVMVECVQNHTPEVMVIDEIGRAAEVLAAQTCKQRGVRIIASAHGDLRKLVKNKQVMQTGHVVLQSSVLLHRAGAVSNQVGCAQPG